MIEVNLHENKIHLLGPGNELLLELTSLLIALKKDKELFEGFQVAYSQIKDATDEEQQEFLNELKKEINKILFQMKKESS